MAPKRPGWQPCLFPLPPLSLPLLESARDVFGGRKKPHWLWRRLPPQLLLLLLLLLSWSPEKEAWKWSCFHSSSSPLSLRICLTYPSLVLCQCDTPCSVRSSGGINEKERRTIFGIRGKISVPSYRSVSRKRDMMISGSSFAEFSWVKFDIISIYFFLCEGEVQSGNPSYVLLQVNHCHSCLWLTRNVYVDAD